MPEELERPDLEPRYELGQFICLPEHFSLRNNIRYIVAEVVPGMRYVLHLNSTAFSHKGIKRVAGEEFSQFADAPIVGGGFLDREIGENGVIDARLDRSSQSFQSEPVEVRAAFQPIVRQKLVELGLLPTEDA